MSIKSEHKGTTKRYSDAFKRQVVEAVEEGDYTHPQAARIYGCAQSSIHRWLKQYGKNHLLNKVVKIQTMDERERINELHDQLSQLKEALAEAHMAQKLSESRLELACNQLGEDPQAFKKKHERRS